MALKPHIHLLFHGRFPSEKAHALFAAKSAEAFIRAGHGVTLLVPNRAHEAESAKAYYNLDTDIEVVYLPTIDFIHWPFFKYLSFYLSNLLFSRGVSRYLKQQYQPSDVVYTNETFVLRYLAQYNVCFELHDFPGRRFWWFKRLFKNADHILITNEWKQKRFIEYFPELAGRTFVEQNAADIEMFNAPVTVSEARATLDIKDDQHIVVYTGHLYGWKGAQTLAAAAQILDDTYHVYFIGGKPEDVDSFKAAYGDADNIHLMGHRPYQELALWQQAADVLVVPNSGREDVSRYYTSPMKLFLHFAAKRKVVASDLPSIREIAADGSVYYAEADNPESFAQTITAAIQDTDTAQIETGFAIAKHHTWEKRARRILDRILV